MSSKTLCNMVRFAVIATTLCALFISLFLLPSWGKSIVDANPEFANLYFPWMGFLWVVILPCFVILFFVWKVSGAIKREEVFTFETAKWVRISAVILFSDAGFFLAGNIILSLINMNHPGILLLSMLGDMFAIALALLAAVLSRYITKAAVLQEESEGII